MDFSLEWIPRCAATATACDRASVFKVVLRQRGESDALQAVALMQQGTVVELDAALALSAAKLGVDHKLPLADSIVYATAQRVHGTLWTQDKDFDGLAAVEYHPKTSAK